MLVVHSGSRGLGERILRAHTEVHGAGPAADPAAYLARHDDAVRRDRAPAAVGRAGPRECAWAPARLLRRLEADAGRHHVRTDRRGGQQPTLWVARAMSSIHRSNRAGVVPPW